MSSPPSIICIHGNLGGPRDWAQFDGGFSSERPLVAYDLWEDLRNSSESSPRRWAQDFCERYRSMAPIRCVAYSLGARLLAEALAMCPQIFARVVLVSCNLPELSADERSARDRHDQEWAERFADPSISWDELLEDWNAQPVLRDSIATVPRAAEFDRTLITRAFREWSLARNTVTAMSLAALPVPVLWMIGERDAKAQRLAMVLKMHPSSNIRICSVLEAGHRVPWDAPVAFQKNVSEFFMEAA